LACSGGILAAGRAQAAIQNAPESPSATAPDAWFDHATGVIIVRKTYRLPVPDRRRQRSRPPSRRSSRVNSWRRVAPSGIGATLPLWTAAKYG